VELRGLEPLTPTLPAAGRHRDLARLAANGRVGGIAGAAAVVTVVVKTVVRSWRAFGGDASVWVRGPASASASGAELVECADLVHHVKRGDLVGLGERWVVEHCID
jgi:hypothetical protein